MQLYLEVRPDDPGDLIELWGEDIRRRDVLDRLSPGLDLVWSDRPDAPDDLKAFLQEARKRAVNGLYDLGGEEDFVPAGLWTKQGRDLLLEHLQREVDALIGGVKTESIWHGFGDMTATEAVAELVATGMLIKLRSVGAFLVLPTSLHDDELTAADFFSAGRWEDARTERIAAHIIGNQTLAHKQIAHLTITRPLPEDTWVYRPSTFYDLVVEQITLLEDFTREVHPDLVTDGWAEWVDGLRTRLVPEGFEEGPFPSPDQK